MLEVKSLIVAYGNRLAVNNVSFRLESGQILGLIGPNGAGKSTLIRAISGVMPIQSGSVWLQGRRVESLSSNQRARLLAVVPQARNMPPAFTGREVVALGRTPYLNFLGQVGAEDDRRVNDAMARTNTLEFADRYVGELSGGEQQRLLVARALVQASPILLLDEPTTHLDLQYQVGLLDLVRELAARDGLTVVIALHDLNMVARCADQVALLVRGELQALGTPAEVLEPERLSRAYQVNLQALPAGPGALPVILPAGQ